MADFVDGHILQVDAVARLVGIARKAKVAAVEDNVGIEHLPGERIGIGAGDGDDPRTGRGVDIDAALVEEDQVSAVLPTGSQGVGQALVDKVNRTGRQLFPYLETLADDAVGLVVA